MVHRFFPGEHIERRGLLPKAPGHTLLGKAFQNLQGMGWEGTGEIFRFSPRERGLIYKFENSAKM